MELRIFSAKQNTETVIAAFLLSLVIILYGLLLLNITSGYLPVLSDEYMYYVNAHSYFENHTLKAALTYNGSGSIIFGSDSHGFAYPLLHGSIAKIFGWSNLNLIFANFTFVFLSIIVIFLSTSLKFVNKLWTTALILMYPMTLLYSVTFMQETLHLFFAVILSAMLLKIDTTEKNYKFISCFVLTIIIAGFFRPLWFFYLLCLFPYAKNRKQILIIGILSFVGIFASLLIVVLFFEYTPNYFSSLLNSLQEGQIINTLILFLKHFFGNIISYFTFVDINYFSMRLIIFLTTVHFFILAVKHKSKIYLSILIIGVTNILLLFALYDAFGWRDLRTLSPLFYFSIVFIVSKAPSYIRNIYLTVLIFVFVLSNKLVINSIITRSNSDSVELRSKTEAYKKISDEIKCNELIYLAYIPQDYSTDLLVLPLKTSNNCQIRYIVPYYRVEVAEFQYVLARSGAKTDRNIIIDDKYFTLIKK